MAHDALLLIRVEGVGNSFHLDLTLRLYADLFVVSRKYWIVVKRGKDDNLFSPFDEPHIVEYFVVPDAEEVFQTWIFSLWQFNRSCWLILFFTSQVSQRGRRVEIQAKTYP